ncbi:DUF2637 domain-containing protein [Streptomyces sp. NPDC013161]|uniref:DUF2637 domain-containing protein n=2 Tax=Streptomyces TaxID=1883 RepID=UPI003682291E
MLIGVVVSGAVVIAGIGFAGSYAAVRELALKKGFGNFAYVFPIGIDAGICVLLALDLLLTWIRIPFPLLRQTAWLLTVATIAFNGAAAWPDPLGVGMHAVIPILFVVSVEAARHAIGRIADITADKHMEGVRLTRWLLSPIPTFLLWRRMKLWELRSYEQVIKLEQDRLVYQARLHSRFGRAWRRKAPIESIMPLRLARHGIPLAQTAPTGLAAAGIEPEPPPPTPQVGSSWLPPPPQPTPESADATACRRIPEAAPAVDNTPAPAREQHPDLDDDEPPEQPEHIQRPEPDAILWSDDLLQEAAYEGDYTPDYDLEEHPHSNEEREPDEPPAMHTAPDEGAISSAPPARGATEALHAGRSADAASRLRNAQTSHSSRATEPDTGFPPGQPTPRSRRTPPPLSLTPVDRYYLAWQDLQQQHKTEPDATQLSAYLASQGILDRNNQPLRAKTLARYFLQFRIYTIWAQHRALDDQPAPDRVAKDLAQHGITAQYNQPIHPHDLEKHHHTFEHRWQTLTHHTPNNLPPHNTPH